MLPIVISPNVLDPVIDLNIAAAEMAVIPTAPPLKRMKIWEMDTSYHCPIIGLCLPVSDLERYARRFHFESSPGDLHALHVEAVYRVANKNKFAETLQKFLDRLHQDFITRFDQAKTDDDVMTLWEDFFGSRKIAGPLWAAMTHKHASEKSRRRIHETLHMFMHEAALELSAAERRSAENSNLLAEITGRMEQLQQQHAHAESRLQRLLQQAQSEVDSLKLSCQETETLRKRLAQLESGQAMIRMGQLLTRLRAENEQLQLKCAAVDQLKASLKTACHNLAELYRERDSWYAERSVIEALLLKNNLSQSTDDPKTGIAAVNNVSSDTKVLCVGGRSSLLPNYRALARQFGLILLHHDGGQEDALSRLPDMIHRAEAVICPTDCVCHAAYHQVKRLCRSSKKPCLLFKGMGISSFAAALARIAMGKASINSMAIESAKTVT